MANRILIIGWPKSGKTTLARELAREEGFEHLCTDPQDKCPPGVRGTPPNLDWSECSQYVSDHWLGRERTVIEGVALPRALRKWRKSHPGERPPADQILLLTHRHDRLLTGQVSMGKGMETVMLELEDWLKGLVEKRR